MNMKNLQIIVLLSGVFFSACALADEITPETNTVYTDPDPAALAIGPRIGEKVAWRRHLNAVLQKYPRDVVTLCNRAYVRGLSGDLKGANEDYERALASAHPKSDQYRHILWSLGWSQFNAGDDIAALNFWKAAELQHGGKPYWVPYTIALSNWRLGNNELALAQYDMAVKSNGVWGTETGVKELTHHWKPAEKKIHEELFAAYIKQTTP